MNYSQGNTAQERDMHWSAWSILRLYRWKKERNFLKAIDLAWSTYQENVGFGRRLMMIGLNFSLRELLTKFEKV